MKYLLIILLLSSCAVSRQTVKPDVKYFKVIEVGDSTFVGQSGKVRAVFFKTDCDPTPVYVGKTITVYRINIIK